MRKTVYMPILLASRSFSTTVRLLSTAVRLRDYQEECIQSVLSGIENGHKRLGISLATGSGKTVVFTQLIDRVKALSDIATQTLIIAHRRELVEQAARHCEGAYPDKKIDIEMGKLSASGFADITVASLQSITSQDRMLKFDPARFKLVLVDEAHHIVAPGYLRILQHFGLSTKQPGSPNLVGVSATFSRFDGLKLGAAIDEIVYHKDYVEMIGDKWLTNVIFTTVKSTADLSKVRTKGRAGSGEFETGSLSEAVNTNEINGIAIRAWNAKAAGRKSTLVFCVDINHVVSMTKRFRHYGFDARYVTGETPIKERAERLDAFKRGDFPVLVNCGVFTEGTDIPNIDCILLARPTKSRNLLIQMIGRGMRLYPGKENCHVIDMVSTLETGIVTTPTLFGLDPNEIVSGVSADEMREKRQEKEEKTAELPDNSAAPEQPSGRNHKITMTDYDSVFDLISDTSGEKHIRSLSQYTWVQVGADRYVLSGQDGSYIRLERDETRDQDSPRYIAWIVRALPPGTKSPFATPRELLVSPTFEDALHGCDKYAQEHFAHIWIARHMRWRQGPATDGQLKFLNKQRPADDPLLPGEITKGKAADMITKLKHGAKGRFASLRAHKRRQTKAELAAELEQQQRLREIVTVGPVLH
ncbi:P-loop containing nucleoside triphosphate hydrolase protein [Rhypophila sp. PSN 637]